MTRLNVVLIAAALVLPALPLLPVTGAQTTPYAQILSPEEGAPLARDGEVRLAYHHQHAVVDGRSVVGTVFLDRTPVANFSQPLNASGPTLIVVRIDAGELPGGNRTLTAQLHESPPVTSSPTMAGPRQVRLLNATPPPPPAEQLEVLSPSRGGLLETRDVVQLRYARWMGSVGTLAGFVALDGAVVGTFTQAYSGVMANVSVPVNVSSSLIGARVLSAHAWLDSDAPVRAPDVPVEVVAYNAPPQVRVTSADYSNDYDAFVVQGQASDADGHVVEVSVLTPFGNHSVAPPGANFTILVPADPPFGSWSFTAVALDDGGKRAFTGSKLVRTNEAPQLAVHNASHVQGFGYRVSGYAGDRDGRVEAVEVVLGSRSWTFRNASGDWSLDLADIPERGLVRGEVRVWDDQFNVTRTPIEVKVVGVHRVFYEETIDLNVGAHANQGSATAPPRVRDGSIEICGVQCGAPFLGTTIAVRHLGGTCYGIAGAGQGGECAFRTDAGGGQFSIYWTQVTGDATVRLSGWEV